MHLHDLNQVEPLDTEKVVKWIAQWITYPVKWKEDWAILSEKQCATLIPEDLFRKLKQWSKTWNYPQWIIKENWEIDVYKLNELIRKWEY
jgi:hypothetical protein